MTATRAAHAFAGYRQTNAGKVGGTFNPEYVAVCRCGWENEEPHYSKTHLRRRLEAHVAQHVEGVEAMMRVGQWVLTNLGLPDHLTSEETDEVIRVLGNSSVPEALDVIASAARFPSGRRE